MPVSESHGEEPTSPASDRAFLAAYRGRKPKEPSGRARKSVPWGPPPLGERGQRFHGTDMGLFTSRLKPTSGFREIDVRWRLHEDPRSRFSSGGHTRPQTALRQSVGIRFRLPSHRTGFYHEPPAMPRKTSPPRTGEPGNKKTISGYPQAWFHQAAARGVCGRRLRSS